MRKSVGFIIGCAVWLLAASGVASAAEVVRIAGAGGMIPLVTELAKAYMAENRDVSIEVNQKSIESTGGIKSAAEGKIEIGMTARNLKEDEKGLGLQSVEIARVATVIGVNRQVPLADISAEGLCRVYGGQIGTWKDLGGPNEPIMILTRPDRDATKESVRKGIPCFAGLKENEKVVIIATAPEMTRILSSRSNTIGFTDAVAVDDSAGAIKALNLDGIAPTAENVRNGKYKVIKNFILLTKGQTKGAVKDFIDFVRGPKGARIIEANKAVAVK